MKQLARKQVRLYTLIIHLRFRLLSGPCHLPKPVLAGPYQLPNSIHHTVLDDQPLEHINLTHTVNPNLLYACTPTTESDLQDGKTTSLKRSQASTRG